MKKGIADESSGRTVAGLKDYHDMFTNRPSLFSDLRTVDLTKACFRRQTLTFRDPFT